MRYVQLTAVFGASLLVVSAAEAHLHGAADAGFVSGFQHPLFGLDHVLAMTSVGLWAAQRGGRALWLVPLAFMIAMLGGGLAGFTGMPLPFVETGIAASVAVLGMLIALALPLPMTSTISVVALFAFFHGHAHGTELPDAASPWAYAAGFIAMTGALHALGITLGSLLRQPTVRVCVRTSGLTIAAVGFALLAG